jgi:hypothetical protein
VHTGFRWEDLRKRGYLEDLGVNGSIILKRIFNKCDGGMDWIYLAKHKDRWWAVVNAVMNVQVP